MQATVDKSLTWYRCPHPHCGGQLYLDEGEYKKDTCYRCLLCGRPGPDNNNHLRRRRNGKDRADIPVALV